jgi:hypothetical protein
VASEPWGPRSPNSTPSPSRGAISLHSGKGSGPGKISDLSSEPLSSYVFVSLPVGEGDCTSVTFTWLSHLWGGGPIRRCHILIQDPNEGDSLSSHHHPSSIQIPNGASNALGGCGIRCLPLGEISERLVALIRSRRQIRRGIELR